MDEQNQIEEVVFGLIIEIELTLRHHVMPFFDGKRIELSILIEAAAINFVDYSVFLATVLTHCEEATNSLTTEEGNYVMYF